jgi:ATP-binding cassette subfamily B protein
MSESELADALPRAPLSVKVRALLGVVRMAYRRDPWRTVLALVPISPLLVAVIAISGRAILMAHGHGQHGHVVVAAIAGGLALVAATVVGYWQAANGLLRLVQVTSTELDSVLLEQLSKVHTIDLFDDPELVDRLELLRVGRGPLVNALASLGGLFGLTFGTLVTASLYAVVDPWLIALPVLVVPVIAVYAQTEAASARAEERVAERRRIALHLYDVGTGPAEGKELRVLGQADSLIQRHASTWDDINAELSRVDARSMVLRLGSWAAYCAVLATALGLVVTDASDHGKLVGPSLFLLALATTQLTFIASNGAAVVAGLRNAAQLAGHFAAVVSTTEAQGKRRPTGTEPLLPAPAAIAKGIALQGVSFRYPGSGKDALGPIDLELPAGSVTAIVGPNGAGKTTLINLLLGLRHPTAGSVLVDSVSLADIDPEGWFSGAAIVCQDFMRFELSVRESVGAGDLDRLEDDAAILRALEQAEASSFVADLPGGLDTKLGQKLGGRELSGGQWQRIAMARGLMRSAPLLLVLDEPTVSMDALTEQRILDRSVANARSLAKQRGTVVVFVSHRYATTRLADQILVIDDGQIVEQGTHVTLMAQGQRYADVYASQAAAYRR